MMRRNLRWAGLLPILAALSCDSGDASGPQVVLALDDGTLMTDVRAVRLQGYRDVADLGCDGHALSGTPPDTAAADFSFADPTVWSTTFTADAGRWVFYVTMGGDHFPIAGPKRLAEGCVEQQIAAGSAPTVTIDIHDLRPDYCGDGHLDGGTAGGVPWGEECDDGNQENGDGCSDACEYEAGVCGNGHVEANETCDDGGAVSGDGCSATCQTEPFIVPQLYRTGQQTQPRIAAGLDAAAAGGFAVVWTDASGALDGSGTGANIGFFNEAGHPTANPSHGLFEFLLNTDHTAGFQNWPGVGWAQSGYLGTYTDDKVVSGVSDFDVYAMAFDTNRTPRVTDDFHVPAIWDGKNEQESVVGSNAQYAGFVVAWAAGDAPSRKITLRRFDGTGTASGADVVVAASGTADQFLPAVAVNADGSFAVVWVEGTASTAIEMVRFHADGTPADSAAVAVSGGADATVRSEPAAAYDATGRLLVSWWAGSSNATVSARLYPASGDPGAEFAVSPAGLTPGTVEQGRLTTSVAAVGGTFLVVWASQVASAVSGRLVDGAGTFVHNRETGDDAAFRIGGISQASRARAAITPGGMAMVVWQDSDDAGGTDAAGGIRGRVFPVP